MTGLLVRSSISPRKSDIHTLLQLFWYCENDVVSMLVFGIFIKQIEDMEWARNDYVVLYLDIKRDTSQYVLRSIICIVSKPKGLQLV